MLLFSDMARKVLGEVACGMGRVDDEGRYLSGAFGGRTLYAKEGKEWKFSNKNLEFRKEYKNRYVKRKKQQQRITGPKPTDRADREEGKK